MKEKKHELFKFLEVGVPFLWPFAFFLGLEEAEVEVLRDNIKFLKEVEKTQVERPEPKWTTRNKIILNLHTMNLRDFSTGSKGMYTLIVAPFAGHTSIIADFHKGQSLVENLLENRIKSVCVTEWKSATEAMKNYDIDMYLRELNTCADDWGGVVNLVGLCQGGWLSTMYAARFPKKVNTLVLAGAPIDTEAGENKIKEYAHTFPMEFYEELVALGGVF